MKFEVVEMPYVAARDPWIENYLEWLRPRCRCRRSQWHLIAAIGLYGWHRENGSPLFRRFCWSQIQKCVRWL